MVTEDTDRIAPQPGILDIAPYVGGKSKIEGQSRVIKLSSNENPFGPSPKAQEAYAALAGELHRYPSSDHSGLRDAIGEVFSLSSDQIICGAGSDEVFTFICQAYAGVGDEVIVTEHGFSMHKICALAAGASVVTAAEVDRKVSVDEILANVSDQTKIIFIANPGNPTGSFVPLADLERLAWSLPKHVILVIDGAYAEYADYMLRAGEGYDGGAKLVEAYPNVIMTRTFSKVFGLGAARIGWGYANAEVIDILNRVRGPFNVNAGALAAAEAAVRDVDYTEQCLSENLRMAGVLRQRLGALGIESDESFANFILMRFDDEADADAAYAHLQSDGIIARQVKGYGFPAAIRLTIGNEEECAAAIESLAAFKGGAI